MSCRATQDGWVIVECSDKNWSTGQGNGKALQHSCLENLMNSMKRQKDKQLEDEPLRSVGAHYAKIPQPPEWRWRRRLTFLSSMSSSEILFCCCHFPLLYQDITSWFDPSRTSPRVHGTSWRHLPLMNAYCCALLVVHRAVPAGWQSSSELWVPFAGFLSEAPEAGRCPLLRVLGPSSLWPCLQATEVPSEPGGTPPRGMCPSSRGPHLQAPSAHKPSLLPLFP